MSSSFVFCFSATPQTWPRIAGGSSGIGSPLAFVPLPIPGPYLQSSRTSCFLTQLQLLEFEIRYWVTKICILAARTLSWCLQIGSGCYKQIILFATTTDFDPCFFSPSMIHVATKCLVARRYGSGKHVPWMLLLRPVGRCTLVACLVHHTLSLWQFNKVLVE